MSLRPWAFTWKPKSEMAALLEIHRQRGHGDFQFRDQEWLDKQTAVAVRGVRWQARLRLVRYLRQAGVRTARALWAHFVTPRLVRAYAWVRRVAWREHMTQVEDVFKKVDARDRVSEE